MKTDSQPRSAALLTLVCVTPGYCAPTGEAGGSYFGIIVQPDDTSAATKIVNVNLYIVSCRDNYTDSNNVDAFWDKCCGKRDKAGMMGLNLI
ncbi:MAG: hypothetical protein WDN00_02545 [Limisphaerales bacterium]